jgi:hypothetical protein
MHKHTFGEGSFTLKPLKRLQLVRTDKEFPEMTRSMRSLPHRLVSPSRRRRRVRVHKRYLEAVQPHVPLEVGELRAIFRRLGNVGEPEVLTAQMVQRAGMEEADMKRIYFPGTMTAIEDEVWLELKALHDVTNLWPAPNDVPAHWSIYNSI